MPACMPRLYRPLQCAASRRTIRRLRERAMGARLLRSADELMMRYAEYHRDRRNIASHFVGIPMIVFSIGVLLARPTFELAGLPATPAWLLVVLSTIWYLTRGNLALGLAVSALNAVLVAAATPLGQLSTG